MTQLRRLPARSGSRRFLVHFGEEVSSGFSVASSLPCHDACREDILSKFSQSQNGSCSADASLRFSSGAHAAGGQLSVNLLSNYLMKPHIRLLALSWLHQSAFLICPACSETPHSKIHLPLVQQNPAGEEKFRPRLSSTDKSSARLLQTEVG